MLNFYADPLFVVVRVVGFCVLFHFSRACVDDAGRSWTEYNIFGFYLLELWSLS